MVDNSQNSTNNILDYTNYSDCAISYFNDCIKGYFIRDEYYIST